MKEKKILGRYSCPPWLFLLLTVLYNECVLHIWITEQYLPGRVLAVALLALGFGGLLGLLVSLIPRPGGAKWTAVVLALGMNVVFLMEYFISDAYKTFMTPGTIINGAGGVAGDFLSIVVSLLARNLWRLGLLLLPTAAYALLCRGETAGWKTRGGLAAGMAAAFLLGGLSVKTLTPDWNRFGQAYEFDSAVRCFGLNTALTLELTDRSSEQSEPGFVVSQPQPTQPAETEEPEGTEQTQPTQAPVYGDHVLEGVDFGALAEEAVNPAISSVCAYLDSLPVVSENALTGRFAGKNLILITAEAFTAEVIDPERTPTLYRLANEGIRFTDYYQPAWGASTTAGEFSNVVGLIPTNGGMCMKEARQQDLFLTMGKQLQKQGYSSVAYHNHNKDFYDRDKTHVHLGYDQFLAQYGGLEGITPVWPESDLEMIDISVPQYIDRQPFSVYYITVSGHCMYSQKENAMARKNYDKVADMDASEAVKCYHASQLELEYAMASLVAQLEEAGIADDTVIVLATDHYPYGLERSGTWKNTSDYLAELYGVDSYDKFIRDHNALIIWSGCIEGEGLTVDTPVSSPDILPTLSNLFGVPYDARLLPGRDVFSDQTPLVMWPDYSWKTDKGTYDSATGTFTPAEGAEVEEGYRDWIDTRVVNAFTYCRSVMEHDFFNFLAERVFPEE